MDLSVRARRSGRTHDLRELRLLNESQIKPALQTVPGVAEVASVGGLEEQYQVKIFPPLLANVGISLRQIIVALQGVFQETGGRTIEVTNREYQLRGVINNDDIDKLEYLVIGRNKDGSQFSLRMSDTSRSDTTCGAARWTSMAAAKSSAASPSWSRTRTCWPSRASLDQKLAEIRASLPAGVDIVAAYDRSAWIWTTLKEFFGTLLYRTDRADSCHGRCFSAISELRSARSRFCCSVRFSRRCRCSPLAKRSICFRSPGSALRLAKLRTPRLSSWRTALQNCRFGRNLSVEQRREIVIHSITNVAKPLTFALLIILASFLPVFFLEDREARLFDPLAYSKTFAMAFSTLLTLFLLPIVTTWIFEREHAPRPFAFRRTFAVVGCVALLAAVYGGSGRRAGISARDHRTRNRPDSGDHPVDCPKACGDAVNYQDTRPCGLIAPLSPSPFVIDMCSRPQASDLDSRSNLARTASKETFFRKQTKVRFSTCRQRCRAYQRAKRDGSSSRWIRS